MSFAFGKALGASGTGRLFPRVGTQQTLFNQLNRPQSGSVQRPQWRAGQRIAIMVQSSGGTVMATAAVTTTSPCQIPTDNMAANQITVNAVNALIVQLSNFTLATASELLASILRR